MSRRLLCIFILFYWLYISVSFAQEEQIIPPVIIKKPKLHLVSFSSGPKLIITQNQMATAGVNSLSQALQDLANLQLQQTIGNGNAAISMRGFGGNASSNTLVMLNGLPLVNPDLSTPDLNLFPIAIVKQIEIIPGSEGVLYGDQAVGGVINIITDKPLLPYTDFSCTTGSYDLYSCHVQWTKHLYPINFNLFALYNDTHNYRQHNDYHQNLLQGSILFLSILGRSHLDYTIANEKSDYPGALTAAQVRQNRRQANNDSDFFKNINIFLHWEQQSTLKNKWLWKNDLLFRDMQGDGVLFSELGQSRLIYFLKSELKGKAGLGKVRTGLDYQQDRYHLGSLFGVTNVAQQKYGLYAAIHYPLLKLFTLSLGARGALLRSKLQSNNLSNISNRAFVTNLGFNVEITPCLQAYLRRAGSFRFPKTDENAFTPIGIQGLRTQYGFAYEAGFAYQKDWHTAKVEFYQLNLRDEIAFDPLKTPQQPFGANRNLSPTVRRGFLISTKIPMNSQLRLGGQYQFVRANFSTGIYAGNRIPAVAENLVSGNISYQFLEHYNIYAEAIYTGNQYAANDDANIAGKMGGYTVFNFNLRYQRNHLSAALRVNNLTNKPYYYYTVYQPFSQSEAFYPAPERNLTFSVNYLF